MCREIGLWIDESEINIVRICIDDLLIKCNLQERGGKIWHTL